MTVSISEAPASVRVLFATTPRWGWRFRPQPTPEGCPERNEPPDAPPGADIAQAWRDWRFRIETYEAAELQRCRDHIVWQSLALSGAWSSVPVFGGSRVGWEALLTTLGSSLLGAGCNVTVAELTDDNVTASLIDVTHTAGITIRGATLSRDHSSIDLFGSLDPDALISLVVDALAATEPTSGRREAIEDRALLRSVARHLGPSVTLARMRSALRILLSEAPLPDEEAQLSSQEFDDLTELFGQEIRTRTDMLVRAYQLEHALAELAALNRIPVVTGEETDHVSPALAGAPRDINNPRLRVFTIGRDLDTHEHDLAADLLIQSLLRAVADHPAPSAKDDVLIVAGADHLFPRTVERLLALAQDRSLRIILMFRRLKDTALEALGASDLCVFLKLADYRDATHAAEQIGRSYRFALSSTSRTRGTSYERSSSTSQGRDQGVNKSSTFGPQLSASRGSSANESSGSSRNESAGASLSDTQTDERVYEFDIEPRELQALPETAFFLVEQSLGQTVAIGDCDPLLSLQPTCN
jgi:hypothetical protein